MAKEKASDLIHRHDDPKRRGPSTGFATSGTYYFAPIAICSAALRLRVQPVAFYNIWRIFTDVSIILVITCWRMCARDQVHYIALPY